MRVLVVTVVHVPTDARILHRQIGALRADEADIVYAAPWTATGTPRPSDLRTVDLPLATGRRRVAALRATRRLLAGAGGDADIILLHDPELLLVLRGLRGLPPVVWDVHEDTASASVDKTYIPTWSRRGFRSAVGWLEAWAERNVHLILAEQAYAERFERPHPVVPNHPVVPETVGPSGDERVVYVGRLSRLRGAAELVAVGRALMGEVTVELIGAADADVRPSLEAAVADGAIVWDGYLPNDRALPRVGGALAGLALLHDEPNYRSSMPTKIYEYLGWGVPAITTPLPAARAFIERHGAGIVVPFEDPGAVVEAVQRLRTDAQTRRGMADRGRAAVVAEHNWAITSERFVELLRGWAR